MPYESWEICGGFYDVKCETAAVEQIRFSDEKKTYVASAARVRRDDSVCRNPLAFSYVHTDRSAPGVIQLHFRKGNTVRYRAVAVHR